MWKDITNLEGRYEISDIGEVRNKKTQRLLCLKLDREGYYQIGIRKSNNRKKYWFSVHRLVAIHFLGVPDDNSKQVDHIDHNKTNNSVSNLRWVTVKENNLNREMKAWSTNTTTNELYITRYNNGFMIRINRSDYRKQIWERDLESAIRRRDECLKEIKSLTLAPR